MITGITIIFLTRNLLTRKKHWAAQMINNIIINTIVPVLFAYGIHHNEQVYKDKAIKWLDELSAEKNSDNKRI